MAEEEEEEGEAEMEEESITDSFNGFSRRPEVDRADGTTQEKQRRSFTSVDIISNWG
jgi:hypothetical protein